MNFQESQKFLDSVNNLPREEYSVSNKHASVYLKRLQLLLDLMGNPEKQIAHYIHVTGTSGKGSVTSFMQSILSCSGKKTGAIFSPHPTRITERWKIGNKEMTQVEFSHLTSALKPKLNNYAKKSPFDYISVYEMTEALGLAHFAQKKVDWVVSEVGCGGRHDSSNIIPRKDIAVITNIGLDHVGIIGNSKAEIAYEKAGIIKPGCSVFTSETDPKILKIIKKESDKQKCSLYIFNKPKYKILKFDETSTRFEYGNDIYELNTIGVHQIKNAILCIEIARKLNININHIKRGLKTACQPLRLEVVDKKPLTILDGAHNNDKIRTTVAAIQELKKLKKYRHLHLVVGFSADKSVQDMLAQLLQLKPKSVTATRQSSSSRKVADPKSITTFFQKKLKGVKTNIFLDSNDAFESAKSHAKKNDLILVTGSIFLSGEIRGKVRKG